MEVLLLDENFKFLHDALNTQAPPPSTQIVTMMTRFRKNLSFSWISKIVTQNKKAITPFISKIIRTILYYTVNPDATVRVTAYSTLGGLLVTIAPFSAGIFPKAFRFAINDLEVTPKLSIAVINMFMYLTRFVSPLFIERYITEVPVSFHFSVDVSEFIQYIPQTIPLMKDLPLQLLQNILRSLICSCGRKPNSAFTSTVVSLIELNWKPQMDLLINYIKSNDLDNAAVWLGPALLKDRSVYDGMTDETKELFFNYALKEFNRSPLNLCQFEHACKTCALFFRHTKGTDNKKYDEIQKAVMNSLRDDYPPVYKVRMLFLPTPIEELSDNRNDIDSLRGARLAALATHFEDNLETSDADQIAQMFVSYQDSDNDLYCTFVDSFSRCIDEMIKRCKGQTHLNLLEFILKKKNKNWVHDEAVAHLVDCIPTTACMEVFPKYTDLALDRLLDFELSSNDRLVETSLESLKKFSSYDNIENIIMRVLWSDWHTEPVVQRRFLLISKLAILFKTKLFDMFIGIAYECLFVYENVTTLSNIFAFLSKITIEKVPQEVVSFSLTFIVTHYEIYTHKELDRFGYQIPVPDKYFLDTLDTDIVTNPTINHQDALIHMKNCFAFLMANKPTNDNDIRSLFFISMHIVPIFDIFALQGASELARNNNDYDEMMWTLARETFNTTSRDEVAVCCCQYFVKSNKKLPRPIVDSVANYLRDEGTLNPDLLFLCFILTDLSDHELAMEHLPILTKRLPPKEATTLLFKLTNVVGRLEINQFPDEYALALLEYATNFGGEYKEKVDKYINTTPFEDWPLLDDEMNDCLLKYLQHNEQWDTSKELNCSKFDDDHWRFIISNISLFDDRPVTKYIRENRDRFSKIDVSDLTTATYYYNATNTVNAACFKLNKEETEKTSKLSTIAPLIEKEILVDNASLAKSYFLFSNRKMPESFFSAYLDLFVKRRDDKNLAILLEYALRTSLTVKFFDDDIYFTDETFQLTLRHLVKLRSFTQIEPNVIERIENKIGQKISPELILSENIDLLHIIRIDPNYFINYILSQEIYKAHDFIPLLHLLVKVPFDAQKLISLSTRYIPQYPTFTSIRKKTVFLRFLSCALVCLRAQRRKDEMKIIVDETTDIFAKITGSIFGALYRELSTLFEFLVPMTTDTKPYTAFFASLKTKNSIYPLFSKHAASLMIRAKEPQPCLASRQLKKYTKFILPSERNAIFNTLQQFVADASTVDFFNYIKPYLVSIQIELIPISRNFLTGPSFGMLIMRILTNPQADLVNAEFYTTFAKVFLSDNRRPIFYATLPLSSELTLRCPSLYGLLLSSRYGSPGLISAIERIYGTLRGKKNRHTRELFDVQTLEDYLPLFENYTTIQSGKLLYQIGRNSTDPASFFFMKLARTTSNFLALYVVLKSIFASLDKKAQMQIKTVVGATGYAPTSRIISMRRFAETNPNAANGSNDIYNGKANDPNLEFIIAAAETDKVDEICKEFADFMNSKH